MKNTDRTKYIMATMSDLVSKFLYYDRKEDADLPIGQIERSIAAGEISAAEIVAEFKAELDRGLS